ncbi:MAG: RagB/SusD family nutrient uptake outer membrane protein [Candidatus Cyclobacteriaceae bacterium M2_1C_046]
MNIKKYIGMLAIMATLLASCSDEFLEPELTTSKSSDGGITSAEDLTALLNGALNRMSDDPLYGRDVIMLGDIRSDNAVANRNSGRFITEGEFNYNTENGGLGPWDQGYEVISSLNLIINTTVEDNESELVQHIKGQAYALRAHVYTTLLTLYGQQHVGGNLGVPIITEFVNSADPQAPTRATVSETWDFIKSDLNEAFQRMVEGLTDSKAYPTPAMAKALESRVDLYTEDYEGVIEAAEYVINTGDYQLLDGDAYLSSWSQDGSSNVIFELGYLITDNQGINSLFYITRPTNYGDVVATADLVDLYEAGDIREELFDEPDGFLRTRKYGQWDGGTFTSENAFDNNVELITYAEVLLNYAEALLQDNQPAQALIVLNQIADARDASPYLAANMDNIMLERRKELAFQGFRFYDLLRTGQDIPERTGFADAIPYGDFRLALPIPRAELNANPNIQQNPGYAE